MSEYIKLHPQQELHEEQVYEEEPRDLQDAPEPPVQSGDWIELFDESSQMFYYENIVTAVTTWDKPADFVVCPCLKP